MPRAKKAIKTLEIALHKGQEVRKVREQIEAALEQVRPALQYDGGDIQLVDVKEDEGLVEVRLTGACGGCPMSQMTLTMGVERTLKQQVPGVKKVVAV